MNKQMITSEGKDLSDKTWRMKGWSCDGRKPGPSRGTVSVKALRAESDL